MGGSAVWMKIGS
jgi:hypothetical protein